MTAFIDDHYFYKLMTTPASIASIMLGRLLGDSVRLYLTGGGMLLLAMAFVPASRPGSPARC